MVVRAEVSCDTLDASIALHRQLLDKVKGEREKVVAELDAQLADIEEQIRKLEHEKRKTARGTNGQRRPKGENARIVAEFLGKHPGKGFTRQFIADQTGLSFSSVQRVLEKDSKYVQGEGGLWTLKAPGQ